MSTRCRNPMPAFLLPLHFPTSQCPPPPCALLFSALTAGMKLHLAPVSLAGCHDNRDTIYPQGAPSGCTPGVRKVAACEQWVVVEMGWGLFEVSHESKSRRRAVSHSLPASQADEPDPASRAHLMEQGVEGV